MTYMGLLRRGLNPYFAFLHKIGKTSHPFSDLIEEWRPIIVDSIAWHLSMAEIVLKTLSGYKRSIFYKGRIEEIHPKDRKKT